MTDGGAVLLNISDMIDLAIGTPEVGVVDFNMLQTVLHCLAQQLRILGKNVEVRGSLVAVQIPRDNAQTIAITEYSLDTDKNKKMDRAPPPPPPAEETILVVERVKKSESPTSLRAESPPLVPPQGSPVTQPSAGQASTGQPSTGQQQETPSSEKLSLVTTSKFNILENKVEDLRNRVYGTIPKNEEILEEVRSQTNVKAISDMWASFNVASRLDAAEAGIGKLSSLVQDLINEANMLQSSKSQISDRNDAEVSQADTGRSGTSTVPTTEKGGASTTTGTEEATAPDATTAKSGQLGQDSASAKSGPLGPDSATEKGSQGKSVTSGTVSAHHTKATPSGKSRSTAELAKIQKHVDNMRDDLDSLTQTFYKAIKEIQPGINLPPPPPPGHRSLHESSPTADHSSAAGTGPQAAAQSTTSPSAGTPEQHHTSPEGLAERVSSLEKRLKECCDKITQEENIIRDQINSFEDQLDYVMKQVANLPGGGAIGGSLSPDLVRDLQGLMQLFQTVQEMQEQLKKVHETALQLAAEKEDRQSHVNALLEQIELLKNIKLDREDMVEAMAEKADLRMLARKVSHDQFEMACDGLSRGLEHALGKLNMQESLWQQALDDIQREIETKLDKMELSPVKDFFNDKLKRLQENLKQMASLRREAEAAGTKRKLLRDVNCISCDANAVMSTEAPSSVPVSKPLPATHSMKPYLSYELDAIRKTQASNLPQRNMHDWENIDKQMIQPKQPIKIRSEAEKHMCNRYCGGSHTTTTPAQRVARLGHFIKQWGPDVLPLSSGLAAGDDGRMYRVAQPDSVQVDAAGGAIDTTCTPKSPSKKPELPKLPEKPNIVTECKCLEAPGRNSGNK